MDVYRCILRRHSKKNLLHGQVAQKPLVFLVTVYLPKLLCSDHILMVAMERIATNSESKDRTNDIQQQVKMKDPSAKLRELVRKSDIIFKKS